MIGEKEFIGSKNISDENLKLLIKEIEELKDKNPSNDKIESGIIINNKLNDGLKSCLEKNKDVALFLISKINSIKTNNLSEEVIQSLKNLVMHISLVVNGSTEGNESKEGNELEENETHLHNLTDMINQSFYGFEKMIENNSGIDLNNINLQDIITFIGDEENNIETLDLYIKMASLPAQTKETNKEVLNTISKAIRNHFNKKGLNTEEAKKLQLDEIFKNKKTKNDLTYIYKKYIGENWDGNNLSNELKFKNKKHLNISNSDFINRFNQSLNKINNNTIDQSELGKNMTPERVNSINNYVNIIVGGNGNEFLVYKGQNLQYDIEKVKNFLGKIKENNYRNVIRNGRAAWISAVQIFLNHAMGRKLKIDGVYIKGGETYRSVLDFQQKHNKTHKNKLKEDGIPGPKTLSELLGIKTSNSGGGIEGIDTNGFDQYELDILKVNSEKFYEGYNYTKEEIESHHRYKRGRIIENIQSYVQNVISQKREIGRREIVEHIRSDLVTLPKKEKSDIIQGVHKVVDKFNTIIKYLDFNKGPYKSPKELLCAMRGIKDKGIIKKISNDITVKQHGVGLTFFVGDERSYSIIEGKGKPSGQASGGFNCAYSAIPELKGTLSVINGKDLGNNMNSYRTVLHEGQHNRNSYFMPDKEPNKVNEPIIRAKDEITAYLRDGRSIQSIENILTRPGGLYQYGLRGKAREEHKAQVRTLLKYVKNLMAIVQKNIGLTRDKVISMLSDTPVTLRKDMHDKIISAVKNGSNLKEFWRTGTAEKQTEINEINLAKSIDEVKFILNDPKYSHISRVPNNKGGIEISAIIDDVVAGKLPITNIPPELRSKIQELIVK